MTAPPSSAFSLDAHALVAWLQGEPGGRVVDELVARASTGPEVSLSVSTANVAEVYYTTARAMGTRLAVRSLTVLEQAPINIVPVDLRLAIAGGDIKLRYRMGYLDALVVALALWMQGAIVTGDPDFRAVERDVPVLWTQRV